MLVKILSETFLAPDKYQAGEVINYTGPWGPQFEALDEESRAAQAAYYENNPFASLDAVEGLARTVGEPVVVSASRVAVEPPKADFSALLAQVKADPDLAEKLAEALAPKAKSTKLAVR